MKRKKIIIISGLAAFICIAALLAELLTPGILWCVTPSGKVRDALLEEIPEQDHISSVPDGEIRYLINNNVVFNVSGGRGNLMFENPESCEYDLVFTVYEIVGDGEEENVLYTSPVIKPGQSLSGDKLKKRIPAGEYACMYSVQAYSGEKYAGERTGSMTITVMKQSV